MSKQPADISFVFFGTSDFSVDMLNALQDANFVPKLIVTTPDTRSGRKMLLTPPPVKIWAEKHDIPYVQPEKITRALIDDITSLTHTNAFDIHIVVSYGKIIPQYMIDMPEHGILNVHPSLLPHLRGASPIESTILQDETPGTTLMKIDSEMDHGPIIVQRAVHPTETPPYRENLYNLLRDASGTMLTESIIPFLEGHIQAIEQNHKDATYCNKFTKADTEIFLTDDPILNLRKIRAFAGLSHAFFMDTNKHGKLIRVKITRARITDNVLVLEKVIPEGKKEMLYVEYVKNIQT